MANPTVELLEPEVVALIRDEQYRELRESLRTLDHADTADLIENLLAARSPQEAAVAYRVLPRADASEVFAHLEPESQEQLIDELGDERTRRVVEDMDPDDRARLLDELPVEVARRIIRSLRADTRKETQAILGYPPDSIGRLMTPDYVKVRPSWSAAEALAHIRKFGQDAETVHWVYVVDREGKLIDDVHIRTILLADPTDSIESMMDNRYVALPATEDREEAVRIMNRTDRSAMPVVDGLGLLIGIITYDDIADVAEEEATEDIHKLGGLDALDDPYLSTRLRAMLVKRGPWLAGLFVFQVLTIGVMGVFGEQLDKAVILAVFVPLIISSGGNTGTQAGSLIVRALALREIEPGAWKRVFAREVVTGLILGATLGVLGIAVVLGAEATGMVETTHPTRVAFVVGSAVVGIVLWGSLIGSLLPLAMEKFGLDPAASSAPLIASLMDVSGLLIYFLVAIALLSGTIL